MDPQLPDYFLEDAKRLGLLPGDAQPPAEPRRRVLGSAAALYTRANEESTAKRLAASAARGVAHGVNELARSVHWGAKGVGALFDSTPGSVAKWWESQERVESLFDDEDIDRAFGVRRDGVAGLVEGVVQFGVGFAGLSKFTKPLQLLGKAGKAAATGLAAAGTDAFAFNPNDDRLSDVAVRAAAEGGPSWLSNPLTRFLAAEADDSQAERRFKNALEGFVTGAAVDGIIQGVKSLRRFKGDPAKARTSPKTMTEALTGEASQQADDLIQVVETTSGFELRITAGADPKAAQEATQAVMQKPKPAAEGAEAAAEEAATAPGITVSFTNRAQAENVAATINMVARDAARVPSYLDEEMFTQVASRAEEWAKVRSPADIDDLFERTGLNLNYLDSPEDGEKFIAALADKLSDKFGRSALSDKELLSRAQALYDGENGQAVLNGIREKAGQTKNLAAYMVAHRTYVAGLERHARKLTAILNANPDNAVAGEALVRTLDRMLYAEIGVSQTATEIARALRSMQINPATLDGSIADGTAKAVTNVLDEEAAAAAKAGGAPPPKAGTAPATPTAANPADSTTPFTDLMKAGEWSKTEVLAFVKQVFYSTQGTGNVREALLKAVDTHARAARESGGVKDASFWKLLNDYRTNALLSGPRTHLANVLSNTMIAVHKPATMFWAGLNNFDRRLMQQGWDTGVGLMLNLRESLSLARKAFADGANILDEARTVDMIEAHSDASAKPGFGITLMNLPSRFLTAEDEFFKQLNYRSTVRAQALRQARMDGVTDPAEIAKRIDEAYRTSVNPKTGRGINTEALQYAREATLTEKLRPGTVGHYLQEMSAGNEMFRFIMPFVRTPVNVMRYLGNMTPGVANFFSTTYREALEAGGERAAVAQANLQFGTMLWLTGFVMASDGMITGRGPKDPDLRRMIESTGWRPYSFRLPMAALDGLPEDVKQKLDISEDIEKKYAFVQFRRAEPVFAPLALTADIVQMMGELDEQEAGGVISASLAGTLSAVFSKSYLQGLVDTMESLSSGETDKLSKFIANMATSYIPNTAVQLNQDEFVRDTRPEDRKGLFSDIEQAVNIALAKVPGFGDRLEARRNIFGEKTLKPPHMMGANDINPFTVSKLFRDDDVMVELSKISWLRGGISMPPTELEGIPLRDRDRFANAKGQSPYDRWLELHAGHGKIPPLREQMAKLVRSPEWQEIPEGDEQYAPGGKKFALAARLVMQYREMTKAIMFGEFPEVARQVASAKALRGVAPALSGEAVDAFQETLNIAR